MKEKKRKVPAIFKNQIMIPLIALVCILIVNVIVDLVFGQNFFEVTVVKNNAGDPVLQGNIISILNYGSELAILAIGMTLVTAASGGQDISVGATSAIAGSTIIRVLCGGNTRPESLATPIFVAFLVGCIAAMLCGAFNGALVAFFKIPPMVATLIMYTAGRSIAAWINDNELPVVPGEEFTVFGGYIPGIPIPTPVFIAIICMIIIALVLKFTSLGVYTQAVGINEESSRLNGINPKLIKFVSFVILGVCVAVAGLIKVSRISTINYSVIAKDIEMDAILAVALGGNALSGGKFNMAASILGAYVIQALTTTLYRLDFVKAEALPAYKAVVVIILVVLSAPGVTGALKKLGKKIRPTKKEQQEVA